MRQLVRHHLLPQLHQRRDRLNFTHFFNIEEQILVYRLHLAWPFFLFMKTLFLADSLFCHRREPSSAPGMYGIKFLGVPASISPYMVEVNFGWSDITHLTKDN